MKRRKRKLNFKKIFLILFSWIFIILGYFFVKYRFLIVNSTMEYASNLSNTSTNSDENSEYKNIAEKNNQNYNGIR